MTSDATPPDGADKPAPDPSVLRADLKRALALILDLLEETRRPEEPAKRAPLGARLLGFVRENGTVVTLASTLVALLASLAALAIASHQYGVSPFHYFKRLAIEDRKLDAAFKAEAFKESIARRYVQLGLAHLDQNRHNDAKAAFDDALEIDKHNVEAAHGAYKATVFAPPVSDQFDPAVIEQRIRVFLPAVGGDKDAKDPHALAALGDLMALSGRTAEAKAHYVEAVGLRPELTAAHAALGEIALEAQDFDGAIAALETAHGQAPHNTDHRVNLAAALLYGGRPDAAIDHYLEIFKLDPELLLPYLEMAMAARRSGRFKDSLDALAHAHRYFLDNDVLGREKNAPIWYFFVDGQKFVLSDFRRKYAYAHYSALFSAHLSDDAEMLAMLERNASAKVSTLPAQIQAEVVRMLAVEAESLLGDHGDRARPGIEGFLARYVKSQP